MRGIGRQVTVQLLSSKPKEELAEELLAAKTEANELKETNVRSFHFCFTLSCPLFAELIGFAGFMSCGCPQHGNLLLICISSVSSIPTLTTF
jgi:hypothetical protein